jgi:hypothetical protein
MEKLKFKQIEKRPVAIRILNIDPTSKFLKATTISLKDRGYGNDIKLVKGIIRKEQASKRVMDGWKQWFSDNNNINKIISEGKDLLIMEDDVIVKINFANLIKKIKKNKINFVFYQKTFKEKGIDIPVGTQGVYIPNKLIKSYQKELLNAKSIHFDRWNSRLPNIYYPLLPKEGGEELTRVSGTTGKVRKGRTLKESDLISSITGK